MNSSLQRLTLATFMAALSSATIFAAGDQGKRMPQLVIGIIVEGLNNSDIENYSSSLPEGGLKHILNNSVVFPYVNYPANSTAAAAAAVLMTGASPAVNGISDDVVYDREGLRIQSSLFDKKYLGNFTDETLSPSALRVSTLADELKIGSSGDSRAYSIAASPEMAIICAGHASNSATWLNDKDGRWATSTFYRDLPALVANRNYKMPLSARLDTISWQGGGNDGSNKTFKYFFPVKDQARYAAFKVTPRGNDEITSLAVDYLDNVLTTESRKATDMLTLALTVAEYPFTKASTTLDIERENAYIKLDTQIRQLLNAVDRNVGLDNALVYIAGVPGDNFTRTDNTAWHIPSGEFSPRRALALLNIHLTSLYGPGEWVTGYHRYHFYLNNKLAKDKNISPEQLHEISAQFLRRMSGVTGATSIESYVASDPTGSVDISHAGDVIITVNPGWKLTETNDVDTEGKVVRLSASSAPLYILYPPLKSETINREIDARSITPTLSRIIRIRAPNGSSLSPIVF